jgi:hypothetical protein
LNEEDLHVLFHCVDSILIPPGLPLEKGRARWISV